MRNVHGWSECVVCMSDPFVNQIGLCRACVNAKVPEPGIDANLSCPHCGGNGVRRLVLDGSPAHEFHFVCWLCGWRVPEHPVTPNSMVDLARLAHTNRTPR